MGPLGQFGVELGATTLANAGMALFGQKMQLNQNKKLLEQQNAAAMDIWNKTNYGAQMEHLKNAGLNPGLIYGMGGSGGTLGNASGGAQAPNLALDIRGAAEVALLKAQKENIEADTANKLNQNPKGVEEVRGLKADNESKEVEARIRKVLELDEYGARADELESRKWVADNIVKLGEEGKLKELSLEQLENIKLSNAKTREERRKIEADIDLIKANLKGKNIENAILELEEELQRKTGLDKSSPYYWKALGRLFLKYFGG